MGDCFWAHDSVFLFGSGTLKERSPTRALLSLLLGFGCLKGGNHFRGSLNDSGGSAGVGGGPCSVATDDEADHADCIASLVE